MGNVKFRCTECGSDKVISIEAQSYFLNTGEFFCHSIKTHDDDSPTTCISCWWEGVREDTEGKNG